MYWNEKLFYWTLCLWRTITAFALFYFSAGRWELFYFSDGRWEDKWLVRQSPPKNEMSVVLFIFNLANLGLQSFDSATSLVIFCHIKNMQKSQILEKNIRTRVFTKTWKKKKNQMYRMCFLAVFRGPQTPLLKFAGTLSDILALFACIFCISWPFLDLWILRGFPWNFWPARAKINQKFQR